MTIMEAITEFAMDYYCSDTPPKEYAQQKNLTLPQLVAIINAANIINEPPELVRVKNLIEDTMKNFNFNQREMAKILGYRHTDLCNVLKMRRPLPKKKLFLLEKYVAEHKNSI